MRCCDCVMQKKKKTYAETSLVSLLHVRMDTRKTNMAATYANASTSVR